MKQTFQWKQLGQTTGAFALGATAGSLVALLYAPASGKVIRRRIGMKFRSLEKSAVRSIKQTKRLLAQKAEDIKEVATEKLGHTRAWLSERALNGNGSKRPLHRVAHHS